jgi:hypothetical protein
LKGKWTAMVDTNFTAYAVVNYDSNSWKYQIGKGREGKRLDEQF